MYDSTNASLIPVTASIVGGYINHPVFRWSAADWARFPHADKVYIDTNGAGGGNCLDVETGDATPAMAPGWVTNRRAAGIDPTVYCSESVWGAVRNAFHAAGVPEPHYWIANYNTGPTPIAGAVAHQYTDVGPFDLSIVPGPWPGVDAPQHTIAGGTMLAIRPDGTGWDVFGKAPDATNLLYTATFHADGTFWTQPYVPAPWANAQIDSVVGCGWFPDMSKLVVQVRGLDGSTLFAIYDSKAGAWGGPVPTGMILAPIARPGLPGVPGPPDPLHTHAVAASGATGKPI